MAKNHDNTPTLPTWSEVLHFGEGDQLAAIDPASTPGFEGTKTDAEKLMPAILEQVGELQERLFAEAKGGGQRSLLLVCQGMDTAGKGGIMRHVIGATDPQGVHLTAFKAPTDEEKQHDFLWRIDKALPQPGQIGVFDRSHYEDVLIVRVHNLVPPSQWSGRYDLINDFESAAAAKGITIVKVMLHISSAEQKRRLTERLERPDKYWKYNPGDVDERACWPAYQEAYQAALECCSTTTAPWFVVPADHKWFARLAVTGLLLEALQGIDPHWPPASFDVEAEKLRLAAT